jgi:hypothetical protein
VSKTRKTMQRDGYKAFRVLCQDDNGGTKLVWGWHVVRSGERPRAGEMPAGSRTREEAWAMAEDVFNLRAQNLYV